jgi:hypothetical protein
MRKIGNQVLEKNFFFVVYLKFINAEQKNNGEAQAGPRRPGPINADRPRAAQVRNRRRYNPARDYDDGQQNPIVDDDGK